MGPKEGIHFRANGWVLLLMVGTCIGAASGLYDKYLLQQLRLPATSLQFWFTFYNALFQAGLVALVWWPRRRSSPYRLGKTALAVGVLLVLADQLYFRAMAYPEALVSVVSLTRRGSVLVSFALGGLLFREQLLRQKLGPLLLILMGLLVLLL